MDIFSWSDGIQAAFGSCLRCIRPTSNDLDSSLDNAHDHSTNRIRRARSDELEGLLAEVDDTDTEAETMSLHSNIGEGRRRQNKKKGPKSITFFGWNLFGKPPIQLSENDEDDEALRRRMRGRISSSTLDSDAAPLDSSVIDGLTAAQIQERAIAAEKEERRRRRKERKELKKAAMSLAMGGADGDFEGFPGSSGGYPHIPAPFHGPYSSASPAAQDDYVHIARGQGDDADAEDADLGGELYNRRKDSDNSNDSDSRSRASVSQHQSNADRSTGYNHHYISQHPPHMIPLPAPSDSNSSSRSPSSGTPRRKKSTKSVSSKMSSSSTSQSPSLPSPVNASFASSSFPAVARNSPHSTSDRLQTVPFEGFQDTLPALSQNDHKLPSTGLVRAFPSSGLGGTRGKGRDMGAFLATRGDA